MALLPNLAIVFAITVVVVFWVRNWLRTRKPGVLAMVLSLLFLDLALSIGPFETLTGLPLAVRLWGLFLTHALGLVASYWLVVFCWHLANTDEVPARNARRRVVVLVISLVLLTVFFLLGPVSQHLATVSSSDGDKPFVLPYWAVFTGYLGWSQVDVVISCRRGWNSPRWPMRWGVRLSITGASLGSLYALERLLFTVLATFGTQPPWQEIGTTGVGALLTLLSLVLELAGVSTIPVGNTLVRNRAAKQMKPLWEALIGVAPDLRFTQGINVLHRRTTEIRDVLLGPLQPYLDPAVAERAHTLGAEAGLTGDELTITADAATIAVALRYLRSGYEPDVGTPLLISSPASPDPGDDAEWLIRMSRAFIESPVVATVQKEFTAHHEHNAAN